MKKVLMVNYWLISIAWGLSMSSKTMIGVLIALSMAIALSTLKKFLNYWRILANALIHYIILFGVYSSSNIAFFFPQLYKLLIAICFNSAITNEILCRYKNKVILPFVFVLTLGLSILSFMIIVLPNELYSIFTKQSLFIMACFIFLPYLINPVICLSLRKLRMLERNKAIKLRKSY